MANLNVRMDDDLKDTVHALFEDLGMTPTMAIRDFYEYVRQNKKLPWKIIMVENVDDHDLPVTKGNENMGLLKPVMEDRNPANNVSCTVGMYGQYDCTLHETRIDMDMTLSDGTSRQGVIHIHKDPDKPGHCTLKPAHGNRNFTPYYPLRCVFGIDLYFDDEEGEVAQVAITDEHAKEYMYGILDWLRRMDMKSVTIHHAAHNGAHETFTLEFYDRVEGAPDIPYVELMLEKDGIIYDSAIAYRPYSYA